MPRLLLFVVSLVCCAYPVRADNVRVDVTVPFAEPADETADFKTETLLADLDNPAGLVFLPTQSHRGPYELLLAESGADRVLRLTTDSLDKPVEIVVDFPQGTFGASPGYRVGPLNLVFLTRTKFVVSAKGEGPGADTLAGFSLPTGGVTFVTADRSHSVGPIHANITAKIDDYHLVGLAKSDKVCYVTTAGQEGQGWVLKSQIEANRLAYLQLFIDVPKETSGMGAPAGIAVIPNPQAEFLVVGLMGSRDTPQDSRLAFFVPASGDLALNLPTGLDDIIALAYSPSGQLYAADFSWHDEQAGGIYRIDDARLEGRQTCRATKIASVVRPFAMAFAPDGSLFVTAFGTEPNTKQGSLIKITGKL